MSDITWLLDIIRGLGVAGGPVFAVLFWLERVERKAAQKDSRELLVQNLTTITQASASIVEVTEAVVAVGAGMRDMNRSVVQLAQLVRSIDGARRGVSK